MAASAFAFFSSCTGKSNGPASPPPQANEPQDGKPQPSPTPELPLVIQPTKESIQTEFVNKSCLGCHESASARNRFVDLRDIGVLAEEGHVHEPGGPRHNLIKPGCPKQSFFLSIIREGKMPPPPAPRPSDENLQAVDAWIVSLKADATCLSDEPGGDDGEDDEP